ncbi:DUF2335 domain-containing protein [Stappia sp. ES.058]|uniref:DUF2335 domain-containing protein n=1 Tax=Stappia sp. ES.058 TaxID=1881061 RepID=UPI000B8850E1|nr:DUF2335 domain-containing protein [Stappia sp. ES.058]
MTSKSPAEPNQNLPESGAEDPSNHLDGPEGLKSLARASAARILPDDQADKFATEFVKDFLASVMDGEGEGMVSIGVSRTVAKHHSGPLPPAETLEGYDRIVPGAAERIIAMAERDQRAYIASRNKQQDSDNIFRLVAYGGGLIGLFAILGVGTWLAFSGYEKAAMAVFGMGAAAVITAFVNAWKK